MKQTKTPVAEKTQKSREEKTLGYVKGEVCNRKGCVGVIKEGVKEGSCSCHISPPCRYCVEPSEYCDACEWDAQEEKL